jgi:hypothetical protein
VSGPADSLEPLDAALLSEIVRLLRRIRTNGMTIEIRAKGHAEWSLALVRRERLDITTPVGHGRPVVVA